MSNGNIIYASVNAVRYVPTVGAVTAPLVRTIANANTTVTSILPVANGTYWGDRNGAIQLKLGSTIYTIQANTGMVPTSMATNGYTAGGALVWTQCASTTCQMRFDLPAGNWERCGNECPRRGDDVVRQRVLGRRSGRSPPVLNGSRASTCATGRSTSGSAHACEPGAGR